MTATVRFGFLVFGEEPAYFRQIHHAILSVLAQAGCAVEVVVVTDHPARFAWFGDRVRCVTVDAATLKSWRGPHDYFWRIQLCGLELASRDCPGDFVYLDGDVAATAALGPFLDHLAAGERLMHRREYLLGAMRRQSKRRMCQVAMAGTWAGLPAGPDSAMWNMGVTALPHRHLDLPTQAIAACDALKSQGIEHHTVGQLAMGLALQRAGPVRAADAWFVHFWGNKEAWDAAIARLMSVILLDGLGVDAAVDLVRRHPIRLPAVVRPRPWLAWLPDRMRVVE